MTQRERRRRDAVTLLIAVRERNVEVMWELEAERDRLLARGNLVTDLVGRRRGTKATRPGARSPDS
jgi:hypothetical protein